MRDRLRERWPAYLVSLLLLAGLLLWVGLSGGGGSFEDKYAGLDLARGIGGIGRENTYTRYLAAHSQAPPGSQDIEVDLMNPLRMRGASRQVGEDGLPLLMTEEGADLTWQVEVPAGGMYQLHLDYLATPSRGVDIERALYINGQTPFLGADTLLFTRMWTDAGLPRLDNQGNQIRPPQAEVQGWQAVDLRDPLGYEVEPLRFYFEAGTNEIRLVATNEPMALRALSLRAIRPLPSYAEYLRAAPAPRADAPRQVRLVVEGEAAMLRSSPSLYARYDRSSPATQPNDLRRVVLNYIGGDPWRAPGQWIEWQVDIPEDGFYHLTLKGRQRYQRGSVSSRRLLIDGQVPFAELNEIPFAFANAWEMKTLGDATGQPYDIYLTQGSHRLRLEATLGGMGGILTQLDDSVYRLNQIYRRILVLTGVNPDPFRDYNIHQVYPEVVEAMALESARLYKIVDEATAYTGQKSDKIAAAQTLATQLEEFARNPYRITASFVNFKDNITALGTAMQAMSEIKLDIDLVSVHSAGLAPVAGPENALSGLLHEGRSTAISYFVDYDALGDVYLQEEALEVWLLTGRDQSMVLKTMVDDSFTPQTDIKVNIKLVDPTALLGAVVAGNGPDLVVSTDSWNPVNYALRNAAEDLTQFEDFDSVISAFNPSAYAALSWEGGVYGLPETQVLSVLFYRQDILEELGLEVPATWDELIGILPTIQGNNMSLGIPYPTITAPNQSTLYALIYQNNGQIYNQEATRTLLNEENAVQAFDFYTALYTDYGLPMEFDFISRFRSGEMPLGIADFTTFNVLAVSAPEIRGLWDFTRIPGTPFTGPDGQPGLNRAAHSQGASCMMVATEDEAVKEQAWAFMKWWVSKDAQVRFGREIEAVLGASARYPTANIQALRELSWSARHLVILEEAMREAVGFREIAGGYYTARNITNAVRRVINTNSDPRETILDYARLIDKEIESKRREFGLYQQRGAGD
ncbi:MAG: extracellular solute-binding protein [Clostridiales bacterium]|nr:extracellular solute-binding protein [Clostridiales bacterium]